MKRFKTRAKTAYGLLSEIRALILAEPLRYNQRDVLQLKSRPSDNVFCTPEYPECGTIGCVAGWTAVLVSKNPSRIDDVWEYAKKKLGIDGLQAAGLFSGGAAKGDSQTPEHAESGAAHIARFQKVNSRQLKAKRIK